MSINRGPFSINLDSAFSSLRNLEAADCEQWTEKGRGLLKRKETNTIREHRGKGEKCSGRARETKLTQHATLH